MLRQDVPAVKYEFVPNNDDIRPQSTLKKVVASIGFRLCGLSLLSLPLVLLLMANDISTDFLIIGGGVIGLSIARELRRRGTARITILERGRIGMEASWAAAGMLAPQSEADRADEFFELCSESNGMYPQFAAELLKETGIDIELDRTGTLYLAFSEKDSEELRKRYEWQTAAGLAVEQISASKILKREPLVSPTVQESLFFPSDGQVENRRLIEALTAYCRGNEIGISGGTSVNSIVVDGGRAVAVDTGAGRVSAGHIVLAAGAWSSSIDVGGRKLNVPVKPIRGQMISFSSDVGRFRHVIYSHRGYIVPRADGRVLAGATVEDVGFDKDTTASGLSSIRDVAAEIAPGFAAVWPSESWAGLRPFAGDGLPVLGNVPGVENLTIATGHFRNGILLTPLTGKLIADRLIDGRPSRYLDIFGLDRFSAAAA
jgi:glycine oxidase